jgi:large subunit ribosomal protein L13e
MPKGNNAIQKNHFRKDWIEIGVRTWFNQPGRKLRRRQAREEKAARVFPRPTQNLRPVVRGSTSKYNLKVKLGRGFSLAELKVCFFIADFIFSLKLFRFYTFFFFFLLNSSKP